jgi:glyoxylase-like metal-dependent hydrolase (beta-lactamase superfamily II)
MLEPANLPADLVWPDPPVTMITAPNPSPKTLDGTNVFIVGTAPAYLIDPGPDLPNWVPTLAEAMRDRDVAGILLTHSHPDHAPAAARLAGLLSVTVWASDRIDGIAARSLGVDRVIADGAEWQVGNDTLRAILTPGHTPDHLAFWLERARILFAGDTILGTGTTLIAPPEGDMLAYMWSLALLRSLGPRLICPGHGPVVRDPQAKIDEYVEHRRRREDQLVAALRAGPSTLQDLATVIYTDVDPHVLPLALDSLRAQIDKLTREGRARSVGDLVALTD